MLQKRSDRLTFATDHHCRYESGSKVNGRIEKMIEKRNCDGVVVIDTYVSHHMIEPTMKVWIGRRVLSVRLVVWSGDICVTNE